MNIEKLNNKIVIIKDQMKESLLNIISNHLLNVKIITLSELKRNYYFDYDREAIYYIVSNYNVNYDTAKIYLNNLYYLKDIDNEKITFLKTIKDDLDSKGLLYYNTLFKSYLSSKNIVLLDLLNVDKFYLNIFEYLKKSNKVESINLYNEASVKTIYECFNKDEEITLVCSKICDLIKSGVDINNIKLCNVNSDYEYTIKKYFKVFNIPVNLNNTSSIYGTHLVKIFIDNYSSNISETLDIVYDLVSSNKDNYIYKKLVNIVNSYSFISDYDLVKDLIIEDIKKTNLGSEVLNNAVSIVDIENEIISDLDYVFLINYNEGVIPVSHKDEDYLNDKTKSLLGISESFDLNSKELINIRSKISGIKNLILSYSTHSLNGELYISSSYSEELLRKEKFSIDYNNSNLFNELKLISLKDEYKKYGTISEDLKILNNNYDLKYLSYSNKFSGIDFKKKGLGLSYTSLNTYNECAFKYYLNYILNLNKYEDSFEMVVGNIFHKILSECFNDNYDFETNWNKKVSECGYEFNNCELFFLDKIKSTLVSTIEIIKNQLNYTSLKKFMYEKEINIKVNDELNIYFKGFLDKIIYDNVNGINVVVIVDYKTGNTNIDINNSIYGLEMQLPIYMYLIKKSNIIKDVRIGGLYLQKILSNKNEDDLEDSLKLVGYSNSDTEVLSLVDKSYESSKIIKSMKVGNNGFYSYAKVLSDEQMDKLVSIVDDKIKECSSNIMNGKFDINPKVIDGDNKGCKYCKYRDICYVTYDDEVSLPYKKLFGGEE